MTRFRGRQLAGFLALASVSVVAKAQPADTDEVLVPQQLSARTLQSYCASSSLTSAGRERQRFCAGFVSGVEESLRVLRATSDNDVDPVVCVEKATARELHGAFMRYVKRPDVDLSASAVLVTLNALQSAFPCPVQDD